MSGLFNFSQEEMLSFFAVLVRLSVIFSVIPFLGDRLIPMPVKVLLSLSVTIALFPILVSRGEVRVGEAAIWGQTAAGIASTIGVETVFALLLGFTARMVFESINFGGNLVGNFMGFAAASTYDPHQESQTQVVAQIQTSIAMLLFLALDGHHAMLRAAAGSFRVVGVGGMTLLGVPITPGKVLFGAAVGQKLIQLSGQVIAFAVQLTAPVAVSLFAVNVAFGVIAKALPQMNILVLSLAISALIGLLVMFISLGEFQSVSVDILSRVGEWMESIMVVVAQGK